MNARAATTATPMLRRLRIRFIALNMALAAIVLVVAFATICYLDYRNAVAETYHALSQTANSTARAPVLTIVPGYGLFASPSDEDDREKMSDNADSASSISGIDGIEGIDTTRVSGSSTAAEASSADGTACTRGIIGMSISGTRDTSAAEQSMATTLGISGAGDSTGESTPGSPSDTNSTPDAEGTDDTFERPHIGGDLGSQHESYLPTAVYLYEKGVITFVTSQSSAAVPDSIAPTALAFALNSADSQGYSPDLGLFFVRQDRVFGSVIAFADDSAAHAWQSLAWGLAGVGLLALGVLFLINLRFSRWVLRPVETAWAQQQQFIADASHELKTPLTVILANNAILRSRPHDTIAEQAQWIDSTQSEAERMQALVTDMLDLARPKPETHTAEPQPVVNLSRLVTGEVLQFESVAFERGLALESDIVENLSVRGVERRLERLTAVLLDNACKYADEGGTITVRLRRADASAELAVANTGDPIAPEDLPHLFDRFYRVDKARTHNAAPDERPTQRVDLAQVSPGARTEALSDASYGTKPLPMPSVKPTAASANSASAQPSPTGYGLGLAIAQDIARDHKGTLTATSTAAEGTTFTLRIPLA